MNLANKTPLGAPTRSARAVMVERKTFVSLFPGGVGARARADEVGPGTLPSGRFPMAIPGCPAVG